MKAFYTFFILLIPYVGFGQFIGCNNGNNFFPEDVITPILNEWYTPSNQSYAGEIIKINVSYGEIYTIKTSFISNLEYYNTTLTLTDLNGNILALNDDWSEIEALNYNENYEGVILPDFSTNNSIIFWQATYDGVAYIHLNEKGYTGGDDYNYCITNQTNTTVSIYRGLKYYCSTGSCNAGIPSVLEFIDFNLNPFGGEINEFSSLEECQASCNLQEIWGCTWADYGNGLVKDCVKDPESPLDAVFGIVYPSQNACFENCNLGWKCNYGSNVFCYEATTSLGEYSTEEECIDDYCYEPTIVFSCIENSCTEVAEGFPGPTYSTLEECQQADCEFDWWCDMGNCYEEIGGGYSYISEEDCLNSCDAPISYDCIEGSCYEAIGTSGLYSTLVSCEINCEFISLFECTQQGCLDTNVSQFEFNKFPEYYEDYYESIDDCLSNCELPMVYYCDEQTGCYEDVIGLSSIYYNSINDCETQCFTIAETYNCIGNACVNPLDGSGTFTSLDDCVINCDIQQSFNCINGNCIDPLDGTGEFSLFGECYTSCISTDIEIINKNNFNIFPNPANDKFNLSFYLNYNNKVEITIMNTLGQVIYNTEKSYSTGHVNQEITLKNNGIYFILLESNEFNIKTKIIIN